MKRIFGLFLLILPLWGFSQTYNTTTSGGSWTAGGAWVGGSAPTNGNDYTANIYGTMQININSISGYSAITINNGVTVSRGTGGTGSPLTLSDVTNFEIVNGTMIVYGNLILNNSTNFVVTAGSLDVRGKLSIRNGSTLTFNSTGTLSAASFETGGSGGSMTVNSGSLTVTGAMNINSGSTVTTASGATSSIGSILTSNNTDAKFVNGGTTTVTGELEFGGVITNSGTLTLGSLDANGSGGSSLTNSGNISVTGDVSAKSSSIIRLNPGSQMLVYGDLSTTTGDGSKVIMVGTSVAPPPYADLAIKGNVSLSAGGDIEVQQNGRYANFGTLTGSGGASFQIDNGGQAYVGGDITMGGGSSVTNNNSSNPYGFYYNGTNSTNGGSTISSNSGNAATMNSTNAPFAAWVNSMFSLLPVELSYFRIGSIGEHDIEVVWATTSEKDFDYFILEKSADGHSFSKIGTVAGQGTMNTSFHYSFKDSEPLLGRNYYRLKSVDLDGTIETFKIIRADFTGGMKLSVFPNPVVDKKITLQLNFTPYETDYFVIYNLSGDVLSKSTLDELKMDISLHHDLAAGFYILKYVTDSKSWTVKLVVE